MGTIESKNVADVARGTDGLLAATFDGRRFATLQSPSYTSKSDYADPAGGDNTGGAGGGGDGRVTTLTSSLQSASKALEKSFILMKQLRHPNVFHYLRHSSWNGRQCSVTGLPVCDLLYTPARATGDSLGFVPSPSFTQQSVSEVIFGLVGIAGALKVLTSAKLVVRRLHWSQFAICSLRSPLVISSRAVHHGRWLLADLSQCVPAEGFDSAATNSAAMALCLLELIGLLLDSPLHRPQVLALVRRVCTARAAVASSSKYQSRGDVLGTAVDGDQATGASSVELEIADVHANFEALLTALRALRIQTCTTHDTAAPAREEDPPSHSPSPPDGEARTPPMEPSTPQRTPTPLGSTLRRSESSLVEGQTGPNPILALIDWIYGAIAKVATPQTREGDSALQEEGSQASSAFDLLVSLLVDGLRDPLTVCLTQGSQLHLCYSTDVYEANKRAAGVSGNESFHHHEAVSVADASPIGDVRAHTKSSAFADAHTDGGGSSKLAGAYAAILRAVMELHQEPDAIAEGSTMNQNPLTLFERRVAPWLLDVVHLVQYDAWGLFAYIFSTLGSHRPIISASLQAALLPPVVSRMLLLSKDSVCRVNALHHLEQMACFLPTTELCPDFLLLTGFTFFQTRGRVARFVKQIVSASPEAKLDDELEVILFLCRASKAYARHLTTMTAEVDRRLKQKMLADSKTSHGLVDELLLKEAVLLTTQLSSLIDEHLMAAGPQLYSEALRLVRTLVIALVDGARLAIEADGERGHCSIAATGCVYTISHLLYYGSVELREVALSLMLALCAAQAAGVPSSSKLPMSWQSITQWWLPLVNPLVAVKEERIRVPASQVALLVVGALKCLTPPQATQSSAARYPSHLACIASFERFLASRPSSADAGPSQAGTSCAQQFQTLFSNNIHKPLLLPMYIEMRKELATSTNSGVDEATGAFLPIRSKEVAVQALGDAVSHGLGPLKYVTSADLAVAGDSAVLPQAHI